MSHELFEINGMTELAYLLSAGLPWHGKGQAITDEEKDDLAIWGKKSNMSGFEFQSKPVLFFDDTTNELEYVPNKFVAIRSDNRQPMEVVSGAYQYLQPAQCLDFFDDVIRDMGYTMSSCGVLFGGKQFWAQAFTGDERNIGGVDKVRDSVLLTSGFKGSSVGMRTKTRVVCNNTLQEALRGGGKVKMAHSSAFDSKEMKLQLGLQDSRFSEWADIAERMAETEFYESQAMDFFADIFDIYTSEDKEKPTAERLQIAADSRIVMSVVDLFNGQAMGAELKTSKNTVWGAVNAATEWVDHHRNTKTDDNRIYSAWLGAGSNTKNQAWDKALSFIG